MRLRLRGPAFFPQVNSTIAYNYQQTQYSTLGTDFNLTIVV